MKKYNYENVLGSDLNIGDIVKGYVVCGIKNPFYNDQVELEVIDKGFWCGRCNITVRTVEKRDFLHHFYDGKTLELVGTEIRNEAFENWLDTDKPYQIVKPA